MKSAPLHHRTFSSAGTSGAGAVAVLAGEQNKRQGMAQLKHTMMMCMCCKMSMPVAGALEVSL